MNTGRKQHLPANLITSVVALVVDAALTASPYCIVTGISCCLTELWMWPDRDLQHLRKGKPFIHQYWLLYESFIPSHRHPFSHSLLPGLLIRLGWGAWPLVFWAQSMLQPWVESGFALGTFPWWVLSILARFVVGAVVSDCTHYAMDGYSPSKWLFGKR